MNYRRLGKTGLMVSEIGFGGEWMERHNAEECVGCTGCESRCPFGVKIAAQMVKLFQKGYGN